jgi:hypothetical protein
MSLTLTLRPRQDVYVDDEQVVLHEIQSMSKAIIRTCHGAVTINPYEWTELPGMGGAEVMMGQPRDTAHERNLQEARIQFNAPGRVIVRGNMYRKGRETQR